MYIIFLDFDGVLNNKRFLRSWKEPRRYMALHRLDPMPIHNLNKICDMTGARVVVSSSWRERHSLDFMSGLLYGNGFRGKVIGLTPNVTLLKEDGFIHGTMTSIPLMRPGTVCRGDEIAAWYVSNSLPSSVFERVVILDDDEDMGVLSSRLIKTSMDNGLDNKATKLVIDMMMSDVGMNGIHSYVRQLAILPAGLVR